MSSSSDAIVVAPKIAPTLATLDVGHAPAAVTVKLLRKWYVFPKYGGKKPHSVEMVFVDSEGTTIQGHIEKMHVYIHDQHLHEGHVYLISKFMVTSNVGNFRATRHNYMMTLNMKTIVRPAARKDSIPDPEYVFTPPEDCFDKGFNRDYLVDISGILIGVYPEYEFMKPTGPSSRMNIDLENRGYRFQVTLFGGHVRELQEFMRTGESNNAVIVILWCKVDHWNGNNSLVTAMGTTKLLINPDLPESATLKETLSQTIMSPTLTVSQHNKTGSDKNEFLLTDERHNLAQVIEWEHVANFVVLATIDGVSTEKDWWYDACVCHKKVMPDSGMWYCDKCNTHVTKVSKKYFLKLSVVDASDSIELVVFDYNVRALISRSCEQVYDSWKEDPERDELPSELKGLIGKEVLIKILAEGKLGARYGRQYKATKISDDRDIIGRYIEKWNDNEGPIDGQPEILLIENTPTGDSASINKQAVGVSQDLISEFENTASSPSSVSKVKQVVDITRDSDDTPPLKRKSPDERATTVVAIPIKNIKTEK